MNTMKAEFGKEAAFREVRLVLAMAIIVGLGVAFLTWQDGQPSQQPIIIHTPPQVVQLPPVQLPATDPAADDPATDPSLTE